MWKIIYKIAVVVIFLGAIVFVMTIAPNYKKSAWEGKIQWVINYSDVTGSTKQDTFMDEKGNFYVAMEDIANFFDDCIYWDETVQSVVTSGYKKVAVIPVGDTHITVNGQPTSIAAPVLAEKDTYFLPLQALEDIYQITVEYKEKTNTIVVESMDKEAVGANTNKKSSIYRLPTIFSKVEDKLATGAPVTVISNEEGWTKVRTENGVLGYIQSARLGDSTKIRENAEKLQPVKGNISLAWDYFSEYVTAPNRSGTTIPGINVISPTFTILKENGDGALENNIGTAGQAYMEWAAQQGYTVWPMISNNSYIDTTSVILQDREKREYLIQNIVDLVEQYQWTGINLDFEYMYLQDKENYNRFLIELAPRLHAIGAILSVDVTAPDGSENWSLCFDRNTIGKVADYVVFMAYDQHGVSSANAGTVAGYDWVEKNIQKFIEREEVDPHKMILGVPFYTRLWKENASGLDSSTVSIKKQEENIPSGVEKTWDETLQQYYVEYTNGNTIYKMWLEEARSIAAKLELAKKYQFAGAAYWTKDRETEDIWDVIGQSLGI